MISAIKAEFRKLLTVRSTYFIVAIALAIIVLFAGYINGYRQDPRSLLNPGLMMDQSLSAVSTVGFVFAFAGLLLMGHEYRFNTILYSLTSSNRRLKVLVAKALVIVVFAVFTAILAAAFSPACSLVGIHLHHGLHLVHQEFWYWNVLWRCIAVNLGYAFYAFGLIAILRNQVGAIVTFLLFPLIGESILSLLLKHNQTYLPFVSLQSIAGSREGVTLLTPLAGLRNVAIYVVILLIVSIILFQRRDAN